MRKVTKKKFRVPCKVCHKKRYWVSENGLCIDCVANRVKNAQFQIKAKEGPIYEKWKMKIKQSLEKL